MALPLLAAAGIAAGGSALGGALGGMFGSSANKKAAALIRQAQQRILSIKEPTKEDMQYVLEPLIAQGILTPEAFTEVMLNPTEFMTMDVPTEGRDAELAALNKLQDIGLSGGRDAQSELATARAMEAANTNLRGQNESILQNAQARGTSNSNLVAAQQLAEAQNNARNLNQQTMQAAADADSRALQALMSSASIGSNMRGQDYQQASDRARAMDEISKYNAMNRQSVGNQNVQQRNLAQASNLDQANRIAQYNNQNQNQKAQYDAGLAQQMYQNSMAKQQAAAGQSQQLANLAQQQGQMNQQIAGQAIGGFGQTLGSLYGGAPKAGDPKVFAHGGEVDGSALFPGDDPRNDIVDAKLSPGEIVIPRSAARDPLKSMEFVMEVQKDKGQVHPDDVKTLLEALSGIRRGMYRGGRC